MQTSPSCVRKENASSIADAFLDSQNMWGKLPIPTLLSPTEPFNPVPDIAITPPDTAQPPLWGIPNQKFNLENVSCGLSTNVNKNLFRY